MRLLIKKVLKKEVNKAMLEKDLDTFKKIHKENMDNGKMNYHMIFFFSCEFGDIGIAKWIYDLHPENNWLINDALRYTKLHGHTNVVEWLESIKFNKCQTNTS